MAFLGVPPTTYDAYTLPHILGQITNNDYYNDHKNKHPVNTKEEKELYLLQEKQKRLYMKHKNKKRCAEQEAKQKAETEVEATMLRREGSVDDNKKITYIYDLGL